VAIPVTGAGGRVGRGGGAAPRRKAARVEATVGEMAAALKKVWGEYTEPPRF
jgi:hypothetical protein